MDKKSVDKLIKAGTKASNDTKNPQQRQVIATAGKLRIQVNKGADRGKASN
tara:strand:- start:1357 stop:1509 length:153 start_codon:yes stop_codon:yes gene_type:complete